MLEVRNIHFPLQDFHDFDLYELLCIHTYIEKFEAIYTKLEDFLICWLNSYMSAIITYLSDSRLISNP